MCLSISYNILFDLYCFLFSYRGGGGDFRKDYAKSGVLCALFPDVPVLSMTATASHDDIKCIQDSLGLKNCVSIIGCPDRRNIFYRK